MDQNSRTILLILMGLIAFLIPTVVFARIFVHVATEKWPRIESDGGLKFLCVISCFVLALAWPIIIVLGFSVITGTYIRKSVFQFCFEENKTCCGMRACFTVREGDEHDIECRNPGVGVVAGSTPTNQPYTPNSIALCGPHTPQLDPDHHGPDAQSSRTPDTNNDSAPGDQPPAYSPSPPAPAPGHAQK